MHIIINNTSMIPIYEQVAEQIKAAIIAGSLEADQALPSVRALSGELKISALTVKKAYDRLDAEGFVATIHGKGTYVLPTDRSLALEARRKAIEEDFAQAIDKARSAGMTADEIREIIDIMLEE